MEIEITQLEQFVPPVLALQKPILVCLSPKTDKLCVLSEEKCLTIYSFHNPSTINVLWTGTEKYQSAKFSADGEEIVVINENEIIQILRCQNQNFIEIATRKFKQFIPILPDVKEGPFGSTNCLSCLFFSKNICILLWQNKYVIGLEWNVEVWKIHYATKIEQIKSACIANEVIYVLKETGVLLSYCAKSGVKLDIINLVKIISQGDSLLYFNNIALTSESIAISDWNDQIYICNYEDLKQQGEKSIRRLSKGNGPKLSASVSELPSSSKMYTSFKGSESCPSKEALNKYKKSGVLSFSGTSCFEDLDPTVEFEYAVVNAVEGYNIKCMSLTDTGLSVCYCNAPGQCLYRVYNNVTGSCVAEEIVDPNCTVLLSGFLECTDVVISPTGMQLYLSNLSKEHLALKLLKTVGVNLISQVMKGPGWKDMNVALAILAEGLSVRHLIAIKFALKLYTEAFKNILTDVAKHRDETFISENLKILDKTLLTGIEDNLHSTKFAENLVTVSLNHSYDLLCILYAVEDLPSIFAEAIEEVLMKSVLNLRSYLYHIPESSKQEENTTLPVELKGMSDRTIEMWQLWDNLPDEEIIYQAVDHGFLPLAHTYFVTKKGIPLEKAISEMDATVDKWVHQLLCKGQVTQCQKILTNLGRDPLSELKSIYMKTAGEEMQNFLLGFLSNQNMLTEEEIGASLFLKKVKQTLKNSEISKRHNTIFDYNHLQLTVGSVMKNPTSWRDLVWAELAFSLDDAELFHYIIPSAAWSYLLMVNKPEILNLWIDEQYSENNDNSQDNKFKNFFSNWEISQEMVDTINSIDCTKFTKDQVLNSLSRYGIFCTTELASIQLILQRFIETNNLKNIKCILNNPASNLSYFDFSTNILKFCVQYKLNSVLFSCLSEFDGLSDLIQSANFDENITLWLQSWLHLVQISENSESNFVQAAVSSLRCVAGDQLSHYLEERPLLIMALIVLNNHSNEALLSEKESDDVITPELIKAVKRSMPILEQVLTAEAWTNRNQPDVTLYELLEKSSIFDINKLFGWQESHRKKSDESLLKLPHFSNGSVFEKYAHQEFMNYEYYLKQGRPTYAYCKFVLEQFKYQKKLSKKKRKQACNIAHGLALSNFSNNRIVAACISFIEMLSINSDKVRLHVTAGNIILQSYNSSSTEEEVAALLRRLLQSRDTASIQILAALEVALVDVSLSSQKASINQIKSWVVAVKFARVHNLPLPVKLLIDYCKHDMWLQFVLCLELYQYPLEQALQLSENFTSKHLQGHFMHAFSRADTKTGENLNTKKQPKLKLRDARKFLYSKIGLKSEENKSNDSASDASSLPDTGSAMLASSYSSDSSFPGLTLSTTSMLSLSTEDKLFPVLIACHNSIDPPKSLLKASLSYDCPILAVIATCYEPCSIIASMCTWLIVSLYSDAKQEAEAEVNTSLNQQSWTAAHFQILCNITVNTGHISTLASAFKIFLPDNPLNVLVQALKQCAVDKVFDDSAEKIKTFKLKCQSLPVADEGSFLCDRHWVYNTAIQLVCTTLAKCFTSTFHQYRFLQILCQSSFSEFIPVETPDFAHLQQLQECLLETGVQLDYSALCLARRGSERELQSCLDRLVSTQHFKQALKLARIAGLPRDAVVIAQWSYAIEQTEKNPEEGYINFWNDCQAAFEDANLQPIIAAEFFQQHAETRKSKLEKYHVLKLSHTWFTIAKQQSARKRPDCYLTKAVEVELEMWKTRLHLHGSQELQFDVNTTPKLFILTRKEVMAEAGVGFLDLETKLEDADEIKTLDSVIGELLDQGDVSSAVRLEGLFSHKHKDVQIILTCLSLAEGEIQPYQLSSEQRLMIENTITTSSSFKKRPFHSFRGSSYASSSLSPQSFGASSEYDEIPPRDQQDTLSALEKLSERLRHGRYIGARIAACYRVAMNIEKAFVDIITIEDTLGLLKTSIAKDCINKFAVASDLSSAEQISKENMAQFLCEEIMSAVSKGYMQGDNTNMCQPAGGVMWGCDLDSNFHIVLELCAEPSILGSNLLDVASRLNSSQSEAVKQVHAVVVELLIRSHDCFTASCDMEGIAQVLQKCRTLTLNLLQQEQWQLMVRLITGIGRYTEMSYIFQILKDHEHFEFLLGKGMDKVPGLQLALLEFVKSHCAQDRELLRLVALHFRLYSEVAHLWESDAKSTVQSLLLITRMELGAKKSTQPPAPNILRASPDTTHLLKLAMQNFSHAAEYFLQADKLTKAMQCSHQAELVALQIYLTTGISTGQAVDCLLDQEPAQISYLITQRLSFPQAAIIARAYSHPVDWGAALFQHSVILGEQKYITDFTKSMNLTPALVEDIARRFQRETTITHDMAKMMKQLVAGVQCVEVKYRVASQLGFKDILEAMLVSPDLPYLKDTVWRRGLQKYHH